jgi:asparagine synthase (glutamine-hydrolysing)
MADPSAVPMRILSMEAARSVKVVLSGEGADELFAGYGRYLGERYAGGVALPQSAAAGAGRLLSRFVSRRTLKAVEGLAIRDDAERHTFWQTIIPAAYRKRLLGDSTGQTDPIEILRKVTDEIGNAAPLEKLFYFDLRCWLVEDLLTKKDKMGMSASIEARVPYLDQDVVSFAAALPSTMKLRGLKRKYLFRKVVTNYLPKEILERPKVGFAVPLADWFRGELKGFLHQYLAEPGGFLDDYVSLNTRRAMFSAHQGGQDLALSLYSLLVLELWGRMFCRGEATDQVSAGLQESLR